jgi:hypothetical protein
LDVIRIEPSTGGFGGQDVREGRTALPEPIRDPSRGVEDMGIVWTVVVVIVVVAAVLWLLRRA